MLKPLAALYRESWRYAIACPLLFLVPVAAEAAQHIAEWGLGVYDGRATALAVEHSPLRMAFGTLKIVALLLAGYWVVRWLEWSDARRTGRTELAAVRTFAPLFGFKLLCTLPSVWGPPLAQAAGVTIPGWMVGMLSLGSFLLTILLSDWNRTAATGDACGGPFVSIRRVSPVFLWGAAYTLLAIAPPMAVHYALNYAAMIRPGAAKALILAADIMFVGYLSSVISGSTWFVSEHARARTGPPLPA